MCLRWISSFTDYHFNRNFPYLIYYLIYLWIVSRQLTWIQPTKHLPTNQHHIELSIFKSSLKQYHYFLLPTLGSNSKLLKASRTFNTRIYANVSSFHKLLWEIMFITILSKCIVADSWQAVTFHWHTSKLHHTPYSLRNFEYLLSTKGFQLCWCRK